MVFKVYGIVGTATQNHNFLSAFAQDLMTTPKLTRFFEVGNFGSKLLHLCFANDTQILFQTNGKHLQGFDMNIQQTRKAKP